MAKCPKCNNRFSVSGSDIKKVESATEKQAFIVCPNCQSTLKEVINKGFTIVLYLAIAALIGSFILFSFKSDVSQQMLVYSPIILLMITLCIASPFFIKYKVIENIKKDQESFNAPEKPWYQDRMTVYLCRRILLLSVLFWFLLEDGRALGWFQLNSSDHTLGLIVIFLCSLISAIILIYPII